MGNVLIISQDGGVLPAIEIRELVLKVHVPPTPAPFLPDGTPVRADLSLRLK